MIVGDFDRLMDEARTVGRIPQSEAMRLIADPLVFITELAVAVDGELGDKIKEQTDEYESERDAAQIKEQTDEYESERDAAQDESAAYERIIKRAVCMIEAWVALAPGAQLTSDTAQRVLELLTKASQGNNEQGEEEMGEVPDSALARMGKVMDNALAPLLLALAKTTNSIDQLVVVLGAGLKAGREIPGLTEAAEVAVEEATPTPPPEPKFDDMESAVKDSPDGGVTEGPNSQWECGAIHCVDCDIAQNMDCLATYGLSDKAESAIGKADTDEQVREGLHRKLRVVPVAALTARRPKADQALPADLIADARAIAGKAPKIGAPPMPPKVSTKQAKPKRTSKPKLPAKKRKR